MSLRVSTRLPVLAGLRSMALMSAVASALVLAPILTRPALAGSTATTAPPTVEAVEKAVAQIKADPNLFGEKTSSQLQFKPDEPKPKPKDEPLDMGWIVGLVKWISEFSRGLVWAAGAALVAVLVVMLPRWWRANHAVKLPDIQTGPSHVQNMDIRPDSLPADIGAAAWQQWQRGEQRAALSLLYRGALSRLVHSHGVPIRASSTERECLSLAKTRLDASAADYADNLIQAWLLCVYAARWPESDQVQALCQGFDQHLPATAIVTGSALRSPATRMGPA